MGLGSVQILKFGLRAIGTTTVLAILVLLLETRVLAAQVGIPGPPQPPCIATAPLDNPLLTVEGNTYWCFVRNVGVATRNVSIDIRDELQTEGFDTFTLTPGKVGNTIAGHFTPMSCVVRSAEGTTDSLQDLMVVLQIEATNGAPLGEEKGKFFQQCPPSKF